MVPLDFDSLIEILEINSVMFVRRKSFLTFWITITNADRLWLIAGVPAVKATLLAQVLPETARLDMEIFSLNPKVQQWAVMAPWLRYTIDIIALAATLGTTQRTFPAN